MLRGEQLHYGGAHASLLNNLHPDLHQLVMPQKLEFSNIAHTHISTPEFTFYLGSGPFNLFQFQGFVKELRKIASMLAPGVSFHLGSFPLMIKKSQLDQFVSQKQLLSISVGPESNYAFKKVDDPHCLVNIGVAGHRDKLVCYSKIAPSSADLVYPLGYIDILLSYDQRDSEVSLEEYPFQSFDFDQRHLFISHETHPLILTFELCRNSWHGKAKERLQEFLQSKDKKVPSFIVDTSLVGAIHDISGSGIPEIEFKNIPALMVSANDAQQGSSLMLFGNSGSNSSEKFSAQNHYKLAQGFFGQGYFETQYVVDYPMGLGLVPLTNNMTGP